MTQLTCSLPVLGFAAFSGTGKTTLLEKLIPVLVDANIRIAMIKHAHHEFDVDKAGKDSFRLRKAGASQMLISSRYRHALMTETPEKECSLKALLSKVDRNRADLILVEGFKHERFPKIELHRQALGKPWLHADDPSIIAVACDSEHDLTLPKLDINDISSISNFILRWIEGHTAKSATCDSLSPNMLSVDLAREKILEAISLPLKTADLPLKSLHDRIIAMDLNAPINVPSTTNSAMDGFAIRSDALDRESYRIVGDAFAGHPFDGELEQDQCVRIMTGASLPKNGDTVVMREQAKVNDGRVSFDTQKGKIRAGQNVRQAGEDLKKGACILPAGSRLNAASVGMIASLGFEHITCFEPITIAIFSTGNEVQAPGTEAKKSGIYDANRYTLHSLLEKLGCRILDFGIIEDNEIALTNTLVECRDKADVIISSGGVSVGDADYIKTVLAQLGDIDFWRINMRPGRPLAFGQVGNTPFFGLPGNPVAVMVTFLQCVEPAIRKMQGEQNWTAQRLAAICQESIRSRLGRTEYARGFYCLHSDGQLHVQTTGSQGSGILRSMHEANCLIEIAPDIENAEIGSLVTIIPLLSRL